MNSEDQSLAIVSPNTVLANALLRTIDLLRPKVNQLNPSHIEFVVGTQINGAPHIGTNLVQTIAFLLARLARRRFSLDTRVRFVALDNAPYEIVLDPDTHHAYQTTYFHALGEAGVASVIDKYYRTFFESLSEATDAEYEIETYSNSVSCPTELSSSSRCGTWNKSDGGSLRHTEFFMFGFPVRPAVGPKSDPSGHNLLMLK